MDNASTHIITRASINKSKPKSGVWEIMEQRLTARKVLFMDETEFVDFRAVVFNHLEYKFRMIYKNFSFPSYKSLSSIYVSTIKEVPDA